MDFLHTLLNSSSIPVVTAFILGIMITISPCPLCSNITAIGFISKDVKNRQTVLLNGLLYTLGKMAAYFLLGLVFVAGAGVLNVQRFFERYGEPVLGPFLILCGIFMLGIFHSHQHQHDHANHVSWSDRVTERSVAGSPKWAFVLGFVFSLAFCPYSGVIYFSMLIPLSIAEPWGCLLPLVFGFATGLPVMIIAWLLSYGVSEIGRFSNQLQTIEIWFRRICAILFIVMGVYICIETLGGEHSHHDHREQPSSEHTV